MEKNRRCIVVADYPNSIYKVGAIIDTEELQYLTSFYKYPNIFKPLSWWEHRELSEMPQYLKYPKNGIVFRPYWVDVEFGYFYATEKDYDSQTNDFLSDVEPATLTEYLTFINSKK